MRSVTVTTHSPEETEALGKRIGRFLRPGIVVALYGDLGTGKTVLTRGIARGLGISEPVTSPTFTVAQEYPTENGRWFFHLDMYRLADAEAAIAFGIEEYLFSPEAITVVEWPERIEDLLREPMSPAEEAREPLRHPLLVWRLVLGHVDRARRSIVLPAFLAERLPDLPTQRTVAGNEPCPKRTDHDERST